MLKVILQVDWSSEKKKKKAIQMVSENKDVDSFSVDHENKRLTVVGNMDPVRLVMRMRKHCPATDVSYMKSETPAAVETPQPEPSPSYTYPYPSAPPYLGDNSYYPPQSYPANGPPYHSYPSNWGQAGQPWPPSGGY